MQAQAGQVIGGRQLRILPHRPWHRSFFAVGISLMYSLKTSCGAKQSRPITKAFLRDTPNPFFNFFDARAHQTSNFVKHARDKTMALSQADGFF